MTSDWSWEFFVIRSVVLSARTPSTQILLTSAHAEMVMKLFLVVEEGNLNSDKSRNTLNGDERESQNGDDNWNEFEEICVAEEEEGVQLYHVKFVKGRLSASEN